MAARINKINHDEKTKRLIAASQLLNRLTAHGNGTVEMTPSQVQAAKIVIAKSIPDLKQMELVGDADRPIAIQAIRREIVENPDN
jgi:hypothetical protein